MDKMTGVNKSTQDTIDQLDLYGEWEDIRSFANDMGVTYNTMAKRMRAIEKKGLVETRTIHGRLQVRANRDWGRLMSETGDGRIFQTIPGTRGGLTGVHSGQIGGRWINREAIPWCTLHDRMIFLKRPLDCGAPLDDEECVISTGGPDHKWWKDT